jgi:RNA-binding protein 39
MSGLDVEALLDSTANATPAAQNGVSKSKDGDDRHKTDRSERRDRDRIRDSSRDRDRDRKRRDRSTGRPRRDIDEEIKTPRSEHGSAHGSHKSRRRSRSRDDDRRISRRYRDSPDDDSRRDGDYYRGGGRVRSRSRSPNRYYRPRDRRDRDDRDDRNDRNDREGSKPRDTRRPRDEERHRNHSPKGSKASRDGTPPLTEDERDRRTVFVQQLAARLRTKELIAFFEKVGPVKEAQIVKDRVSGRSKG